MFSKTPTTKFTLSDRLSKIHYTLSFENGETELILWYEKKLEDVWPISSVEELYRIISKEPGPLKII